MFVVRRLTLKAPGKICSRRHSRFFLFFFFLNFSWKLSLDISCEMSTWQTIHMKCRLSFSEIIIKKVKLSSAAELIGTLGVKTQKPQTADNSTG